MSERAVIYVGVDLHKESLTVCLMEPDGARTFEKIPTKCRNRIGRFFAELGKGRTVIAVVESVGFYHWFWDLVEPLVSELYLADASRVRSAAGRRAKTDRNDAETLARLLRQDSLPTAHAVSTEFRTLRQLVRHRERLRRKASSAKSSLRMEMNKLNFRGPKTMTFQSLHKWYLSEYQKIPAEVRLSIEDLSDQLEMLERQIRRQDERIAQLVSAHEPFAEATRRMQTIPGIGLTTAAVIHAETAGLGRFDEEGEIVCYAGLAPRTFQSGDSCRHGAIGKDGPPIVRKCLINAAWVAVRCDKAVKARFEEYRKRSGKKKAIVKLAAKMLVWAWAMEKRSTDFDPGLVATAG